jgi:hypothetical protein
MKHKPLIFILIALFHIVEPLIKITYFKLTTPFSFSTIVSNIAQISTAREIFEFWFLFPIAGLALIGVKRWSYPVFVGAQLYSIYSHLTYEQYTWPYVSQVPFISSLVLLFINALVIIYFALPDVRKPFFDRSVRWWETRTRYNMQLPLTFNFTGKKDLIDSHILNISQTGAFINYKGVAEIGSTVQVNLSYKDYNLSIEGEVRAQHTFMGERGIGVHFHFNNIWENLFVRRMVKEIGQDIKAQQKKENELASAA